MNIIFATNNRHKLFEVQHLVGNRFKLLSLQEISLSGEIPEDNTTLEENALAKARYIYNRVHIPTIADDTGLEINSLNGEPGVLSARYAGLEKDDEANIQKVLNRLKNAKNRSAQFRTIIVFTWDKGKERLFEGKIRGEIATMKAGSNGFGYDPVFIPEGYTLTFAQMPVELKNTISHRYKAFSKFASFLNSNFPK